MEPKKKDFDEFEKDDDEVDEDDDEDDEEEKETKSSSMIEEANKAADRLEKVTKDMKKENTKQEEILTERRLQGKSLGGGAPPKKELSPEDYADEFMESSDNILMPE